MAIFLNDDIECRKSEPLDTRVRVPNQAGLIALNPLYNYIGMLVITLDTLGVYQLTVNDGTTASDWDLKSFITASQASDIITNNAKVSNVQSDWNAISGLSQILNKPVIPASQVNSDWSSVSGVSEILNKPTTITSTQSSDIIVNNSKVGITTSQASDIVTNNAKVSFDSTSSTRLANTSGTNTGDQDLSNLVDLTTNQSIGGDKIFTGATVAGSLAAYRPVINKTASFTLSATELNKGCKLDITTAVVISVDASSDTAFPIGGEIEFYWYSDSGTNTITITASGGQTVVSADAAITLSKVGSCAVLKKVAASYWILTGGLA
tara:strand:+ start:677 stop:1642 length:966 start_codon:yes stop_codon:yes gene_type:complete